MKKYFNKIISMSLFIILNYCLTFNVYASRDDGYNQDGNKLPENIEYVSDFEGGVIIKKWNSKNQKGEPVSGFFKYYKMIRGKDSLAQPKTLWLYEQSSSLHDSELKKMVEEKENDKVASIYNGTQIKPEIYSSSYFMWPASSNGDFYLNKNDSNLKEKIAKHDINDFSFISKPENFYLVTAIPNNFDSTLSSNMPLNYPVPASKANYDIWLERLNNSTGQRYSNQYNLNGRNNRHFMDIGQTFLKHVSYFSNTKNQEQTFQQFTLKDKNNYDPKRDPSDTNKKNKSYYENQNYFFLTTDDGKNRSVSPQVAFSATNLMKYDNLASFPRSTSYFTTPRLISSVAPKRIFSGGKVVSNTFNFSDGLAIYNIKLNEIVPGFSDTNNLQNLPFENISPDFLLTVQSCFYTYGQDFYWKVTTLANDTFPEIEKIVPEFRDALDLKGYNELGEKNYAAYYKLNQVYSMVLAKYFLINGFGTDNSPAKLTFIDQSGYAWGDYSLPNYSYSNINVGRISKGNIQILNEPNNSGAKVYDLLKALNVSDHDYYDYLAKFQKNNNDITPCGQMSKRAAKFINASLKKENVGIYLLPFEQEAGEIPVGENYQSGRIYVCKATIIYDKDFAEQQILKDFKTNPKYNISTYKDIKLSDLEEYKKDPNKNSEKIKLAEQLQSVLDEFGSFPLFEEQIHMRTANPKLQFMAIYSDVEGYGSTEIKIPTSSKAYLNEIDPTLYDKTFNDVETLAEKYYPEIYLFENGTPLIDNNRIRFKPETGKYISGLTAIDKNNSNYKQFDFVEVEYSTSSLQAKTKLLLHTLNAGADLSMSIFDGDLISRFSLFAKSATEVYGYFNLKNVYENGEFNADNSLDYYATFVVPQFANKYTGGKLYASDENGSLYKGNIDLYSSNSTEKTSMVAQEKAKSTRGVKFIMRIATHDGP